MSDTPSARLAARLAGDLASFARGDRATKGLPRLAPEVWTAAETHLRAALEAYLNAFSEDSSVDLLHPTLTRAVATLNAAETALFAAREQRKSAPDLKKFEENELAAWRERSRARRALLIAARLSTPKPSKP